MTKFFFCETNLYIHVTDLIFKIRGFNQYKPLKHTYLKRIWMQ